MSFMVTTPQESHTKSEADIIMEKYIKTNKQLAKKEQQFKKIDHEDEQYFAVFSSVLSGWAIGALAGILTEELNAYSMESAHGTEVGLSVGATVCTLGIIYYILKRKRVLKQISKLEEQREALSKAYDQAETKQKDSFVK